MQTRRGVFGFVLLAPLAAAGCGWRPLYADPETGPTDAELRAIRVDPIADRAGQRLELALRRAFNPDGVPTPTRYALHMALAISLQDLGIQTQGLGTLGRIDVSTTFVLTDAKTGQQLLTANSHSADSFDILANGYATVVAQNAARDRAVEEIRRDVVTKLTLFFQRRAAATG